MVTMVDINDPSTSTDDVNDESDSLSELLTKSCALTPGVIEPVLVTKQRDVVIYTFTITAEQMIELCRVERFGDAKFGVNRRFRERHAIEIAEAMLEPDTTFTENPRGSLENGWVFDNGVLSYTAGAYIVLDDGQHRRGALEVMSPEERQRWEFVITCTQGVPYATRLKLFLQQDKGTRIDTRLKLAMRSEIDDWDSDAQRRAYGLCVELATAARSPLKDLIILNETDRRPYEGKHRPAGINVSGLWQAFTSLMGRNSPLAGLPPEKQLDVCKNIILAASVVWKGAWKSPKHVLTTAKGINALVRLVIAGRSFRVAVDNDFTYERLQEVFALVPRFDWSASKSIGESEAQLRERLDSAIGMAMAKRSSKDIKA